MKVSTGGSQDVTGDSYELVDTITADQIEKAITSGGEIQVNLTKTDNPQRQAIGTVQFEGTDIAAMVSGLVARLSNQKECLRKHNECLRNIGQIIKGSRSIMRKGKTEKEILLAIERAMNELLNQIALDHLS